MEQISIVCPGCGLTRQLPRDRMPPKPVTATCPRCRERFLFDPARHATVPVPPENAPAAASPPPEPPPPASPPVPPVQPPEPLPAPPVEPPHRPAAPPPGRRSELRGIGELLGDAWQLFQRRFGTLFATYLLFLMVAILPPFLGAGLGTVLAMVLPFGKGTLVALCVALGGLAGTIGFFWGWGACVAASLDDTLSLREAFSRGGFLLGSFAWVCMLAGFIVTGGMLLFLIPGIIFSIWFFFAPFIVLDDDTRGMSALFKSRAYLSGRWFDVFLRLVVVWACTAVVGAIPVVGALAALVALPYLLVYQALLYRDLKEVAGPVAYSCSTGDYARVLGLAALGYVVVPAVLAGVFGTALYRQLQPFVTGGSHISLPMGASAPAPAGGEVTDDGYRVIPIPGAPAGPAVDGGTSSPPAVETATPGPSTTEQQAHPEHIHVFIYAVNYTGTVRANGSDIQELGNKPDMQYNYNLNGEKLVYGRNSITVDFAPLQHPDATMSPRLHLKFSYWNGNDRQVLGDWEIKESAPGQKTFDLDIPENR